MNAPDTHVLNVVEELKPAVANPSKPGGKTGLQVYMEFKDILTTSPAQGWKDIWKDIEDGWFTMQDSYRKNKLRLEESQRIQKAIREAAAKKKSSGSSWFETKLQDEAIRKLHANDEL